MKILKTLPFLPVLSTVWIVSRELPNGIVTGKYFWFYGAIVLVSATVFSYCLFEKKSYQLAEAKSTRSEMEKNSISKSDLLCYSNGIAELVCQFQQFQHRNESDSLFGQAPVLMYRYSQFSCDGCIQVELDALYSLQNEIGKKHIRILPAYDDTRNNRIKLLHMLHRFNYRIIPVEDFLMPADCDDRGLKRFFAFINKEGSIGMIFFPEVSKPQLTKHYFSEIKKILENAE